ncbi:MAG: AAA family ATPase [Cyclobacteriaceae bacterium]
MKKEQKELITAKLKEWIKSNSSSQAQLAKKADVSSAYISKIASGIYMYENSGREATPISDQVFYKIADAIGLRFDFEPHFNSDNFQRLTTACKFAQFNHRRVLIDSRDSGLCKTYSLEKYASENKNVLYIKCTSLMKGRDLIQLLLDKLNIRFEGRTTNTEKLAMITEQLLKPGYLIILDEFENVAPDMFRVLKDIEDSTYQRCGLMVCGMGITQDLESASKNKKKLGPQLWRRFRVNRIKLGLYKKEYTISGCAEYGITNGKVVTWLCERVTDYAMLSEYVKDIHTHLIGEGKDVSLDNIEALFQPL